MNSEASLDTAAVFQFKGGLYPLTSIQLLTHTLLQLPEQLKFKLQQAPKFFHHAPVVLDLQKINRPEVSIDFPKLKKILEEHDLVPVGIKHGNAEQNSAAIRAGFAVIQENLKEAEHEKEKAKLLNSEQSEHSSSAHTSNAHLSSAQSSGNQSSGSKASSDRSRGAQSGAKSTAAHPNEEVFHSSSTKIITEPVRSGQQIYARESDLVVLAPVSHGAELLADGNIHIYAPLRGRALAGVTGDTNTHIFCQSLEAELISVAGQYKISEDIESEFFQKMVDIAFRDGRLQIRAL